MDNLILTKINICEIQVISFITKKDPILKDEFHINYKKYRNLISTLIKKSKQPYHNKYFETNWDNIKSTWKRTKLLMSLKL